MIVERFNHLFNAAANLLEASEKSDIEFNETIRKIDSSAEKLIVSTRETKEVVKSTILQCGREMAAGVSAQILEDLNEANVTAKKAAQRYENAARYSVLRLSVILFVQFAMGGFLLWWFFVKEIPTIEEINELRRERSQLEGAISNLKKYGSIESCGDNICVMVDLNADNKYFDEKGRRYHVVLPK